MGRFFRIKLRLRRFLRRHSWVATIVRSFTIFSVAFGGAFGFISGALSQHSGYDPNTFAIGVSFDSAQFYSAMNDRIQAIRRFAGTVNETTATEIQDH